MIFPSNSRDYAEGFGLSNQGPEPVTLSFRHRLTLPGGPEVFLSGIGLHSPRGGYLFKKPLGQQVPDPPVEISGINAPDLRLTGFDFLHDAIPVGRTVQENQEDSELQRVKGKEAVRVRCLVGHVILKTSALAPAGVL